MKKSVLIVDDNEHLRRILGSILHMCGYEVSEASTGADAIQKAISKHPGIILMDIQLPDMSGLDAARALKNNPSTFKIPILGCSASVGWEWKEQALGAGMVDFLVKPVSATTLKAKLGAYLSDR